MTKRKNSSPPSRRQFFGMLGGGALSLPFLVDPIRAISSSIVEQIITEAKACGEGNMPRSYIGIFSFGGTGRIVSDLPLVPYDGRVDKLVKNVSVMTKLTKESGQISGEYSVIESNGIYLPSIWENMLPTSSGDQIPMTELVSNMLLIRGVRLPSDGHLIDSIRSLRPAGSSHSLNAAVADVSDRPIPAISMAREFNQAYLSRSGTGVVKFESPTGDNLKKALTPFKGSTLSFGQNVDLSIQAALQALGEYSVSNNPGASSLYRLRSKAEKLLKEGIGNSTEEHSELVKKYQFLIDACTDLKLKNITDFPQLLAGELPYKMRTFDFDAVPMHLTSDCDLMKMLVPNNSGFEYMASAFATAEYLAEKKLSSSVLVATGRPIHLSVVTDELGFTSKTWNTDEHESGQISALIVNSYRHHCTMACLNELIRSLKKKNLFDETVIQLGSEFTRSPRNDGSGSDHGWMAQCTSLFSGAIKEPLVLGNCQPSTPSIDNEHLGDWGVGAPVQFDDGTKKILTNGELTSTVAHLLRVAPPVPSRQSLVQERCESQGGLDFKVEKARNVYD